MKEPIYLQHGVIKMQRFVPPDYFYVNVPTNTHAHTSLFLVVIESF